MAETEIKSINGRPIADTTARKNKADKTGWGANKYIGTDENGNLVEKDLPETGTGGITQETDPTVPAWAKQPEKPTYTKTEIGLDNVDNVRQYSTSNPPPYPVIVIPYGDTTYSFAELHEKASSGVVIGVYNSNAYTAWMYAYDNDTIRFDSYTATTRTIISYGSDGTWETRQLTAGSLVKEFYYGQNVSFDDILSEADSGDTIFLYNVPSVDGITGTTGVFAGIDNSTKTAVFIADIANGKRVICKLIDTTWSYEVEDKLTAAIIETALGYTPANANDVPAVDNTLKVTGAAADAAKVGEEISNLSTAIAEQGKKLCSYVENNKWHFPTELWANGGLNFTNGSTIQKQNRIITSHVQSNDSDIIVNAIDDGFRSYVVYYTDADGTALDNVVEIIPPYTIPAESHYRLMIRRTDESDTEIADINLFVSSVCLRTYLHGLETILDEVQSDTVRIGDSIATLMQSVTIKHNLEFEKGTILNSSGAEAQVSTWIRSIGYAHYGTGLLLEATLPTGYRGNICRWTRKNDNYVWNKHVSVPENSTVEIPVDNNYFRFTMTRIDGQDITVEESVNMIIKTKPASEQTSTLSNKNLNVLHPEYEIMDVPASMLSVYWSDFCIINGNIWLFRQSSDEEHVNDDGRIVIYSLTDFSLVKEISHNFGHMNTCSYDSKSDTLLVGNLPGSTDFPCALYIFYNVSGWLDETTLTFDTVDKTIVDLQAGGWTSKSQVSATFGENNGVHRNIVYLSLNYGAYFAKVLLGMGSNEFEYGTYAEADEHRFNGTFNVLKETETNWEFANAFDEVWQGCDYYKGKVLTCNGDKRIASASLWNFNYLDEIKREIIRFDVYTSDGDQYESDVYNGSLFPEGIAYDADSDYIYMGLLFTQNTQDAPAWHLVRFRL